MTLNSPYTALIIIGALMAAVTFVCSLTEAWIRNLTPAQIARFSIYYPLIANALEKLQQNRLLTLATLATIVVPCLITGTFLAVAWLDAAQMRHPLIPVFLYSWFLVLAGIIVPQSLGNRLREPLAFIFGLPLRALTIVLYPLTAPMAAAGRCFDRSQGTRSKMVPEDIAALAQSAAKDKIISREQAQLIARSTGLSRISAADIMVHRNEMHPISDNLTLADALVEAHNHHHTRFPLIHDKDIDQVIGYVNFKDIVSALRINPADPTLYGIKRPIESVRASTKLPQLLLLFTRGSRHIVIVKDEEQRTLGMITLEDLIETLLGDIEDEYDKPPDFISQITATRFRAGGGATFAQIHEKISDRIPAWEVTINEWISGQTNGPLHDRFSVEYEGLRFNVRKISRGMVFDVLVDRLEIPPQPAGT